MIHLDKKTIEKYIQIYKNELLENVIPFWTKNCVDYQYGGFTFCLGREGQVIDTDKGVWHQGRFTWMLGALYNEVEQKPEWLKLMKHGVDFLDKYCFRESDRKMWFTLDKKGKPLRMRRYAFSESFAAIAYAEYFKATGDMAYAEKSRRTFSAYVKYNTTPPDEFPPKGEPTRPMKNIGYAMIGIATAQVLRDCLKDESFTKTITDFIHEIEGDFMNEEFKAVMETVGPNGEFIDHFDGRTLNPGHAIEGAWFTMYEGMRNKNRHFIDLGCKMLDWMWEIGWDKEYGGIYYFRDVKGLPVQEYWHDMKFWWPQCETIIATQLAYTLTGEEKYWQRFEQIHDWTFKHFPDSVHGEWYGYLHRDGRISVDLKGNIWKGPFHIPRMLLKVWQYFEILKAGL